MGMYMLKANVYPVEAFQLTPGNVDELVRWCGGLKIEEIDPEDSGKRFVGINVPTISGVKRCSEGDYLFRQHQYGFEVLSASDFEAKYQLVE